MKYEETKVCLNATRTCEQSHKTLKKSCTRHGKLSVQEMGKKSHKTWIKVAQDLGKKVTHNIGEMVTQGAGKEHTRHGQCHTKEWKSYKVKRPEKLTRPSHKVKSDLKGPCASTPLTGHKRSQLTGHHILNFH